MPIYAYRCAACGHAQDVLQKISDPLLTRCTACGAEAFEKQVTAAGFQLKGSGWYVTDFRSGNGGAAKKEGQEGDSAAKPTEKAGEASASSDKPAEKASGEAKPASPAPASAPAAATATKAPSPSPSSSGH